jgi:hypothetical protein
MNDHPMAKAAQLSPEEVAFRYDGLTSLFDLGLDFWWFDENWHGIIPGLECAHGTSDCGVDHLVWGQEIFRSVTAAYNDQQGARFPAEIYTRGCSGRKLHSRDAIGSHACSLEASRRVTNDIPLGYPLLLPVHIVNSVQTLKARTTERKQALSDFDFIHVLVVAPGRASVPGVVRAPSSSIGLLSAPCNAA